MAKPNFASGTIWTGDNLEIMRGMNSACVDLIYLDPPFNSNRTYSAPIGSVAAGAAFKDAWTLDDVDEFEHGELAERNPAAGAVIEAARLAHGKPMMAYLIFMAVRLLEMRRVLKPTGSVYLHCDDTAAHWLRVLTEAIFGPGSFRNEVIWKRIGNHNDAGRFGRTADRLLFYGAPIHRAAVRVPLHDANVTSKYRYRDARGKYSTGDLTAKGLSGGGYYYDFHGHPGPWRYPEHRLLALEAEGRIYRPAKVGGVPRLKRYLADSPGQVPPDVWNDIPPVNSQAAERTGYPTQKPLALLDRIIRASSNPGDLVLDPFCGCATTLVVADRLGRDWAGIDLSPLAIKLVNDRITADRGKDGTAPLWGGATALDRPPKRTDLGPIPPYRTNAQFLYGKQIGNCAGCGVHFPFSGLTVDHILPRSRGGTDHLDNLQLLCLGCNSSKGNRTMPEWRAAQRRGDKARR